MAKGKRYAIDLLMGALGVAAVLLAIHLWHDHQALHQLISIEIARERAQQTQGK